MKNNLEDLTIADVANALCNYIQPKQAEAYILGFEEGVIWFKEHSNISELEAQNKKYEEALGEVGDLLSRLEDYTHGRDGVDITTARLNISKTLNHK